MSRRSARLSAYQLIFGYLFSKEIDYKTCETMKGAEDISESDAEYIDNVVNGVKEHYDELMQMIADNSKNFKIDRIYKPDLAGLLLACYEMKYIPDIPLKVSISEVIEIVKTFSTENSNKFVNGVLKGVFNELNKEV